MKLNLSKRQARKFRKKIAACVTFAALMLAVTPANAEPVTAAIAAALVEIGVSAATAAVIASAVVSFAVSTTLSYAINALTTKSSSGGYSSAALGNRTHMVRSPVAARAIVYGRSMVSGPLAFIGTSDRGDGPNGIGGTTLSGGENQFLHLVVMLANHEIDAVEEVYLGDEPLGFMSMVENKPVSGKYGGVVSQGEAFTSPVTMAANATVINIGNFGASSIIGLVEVGTTVAAAPGGGEGGVDSVGNPILPNGGTASIDTPYTFVNATTVTTPAVNRVRNMALTYVSAGLASSYVECHAHLGSPTQLANSVLKASCPDEWTSAHRLQGIAYLYLRLIYNAKIFPNGIPNVKAKIRGAKVRDPRKANYPLDTPTWTSNYTLCAMDYLKASDGLGCADADLDLDQIKVSANICDEVVTIRQGTGSQGVATLPMYQNRYEAHGVLLLDHDVEENLRSLSTAGGGPVPLLIAGRFNIPVGYYGTPNVASLTASDLRGAVKVRPRTSRRDLFNAVGGTYVDGRISWQPTDFPEVANTLYKTQDGGEKIRRDITLPFTTDEIMAQRLAKIMLERSRQGIVIEWPGKPSCFRVAVNDLVPVTMSKFGWTNKVFRCIGWSMQSNGAIDLVLQEDATGIYDWNYGQATTTDLSKDTDLPDPSYVAPMGALTIYSDSSELIRTGDGTIVSRMHVLWPETIDNSVRSAGRFEIQYKKAAETFWTPWDNVPGQSSETWIFPVVDTETYFVRVRAVNGRDIPTDWVYGKHKIIGNTAPPPNVSGFSVTVRADGTRSFAWTTSNQPVNVTTGGGYRLKYRAGGSTAAWSTWTPLHNGLLSQSPLQIADPAAGFYDFGIVAVNANRVESSTPAMINDATIGKEPVSYEASANLIPNSDWQLSTGDDNINTLYQWGLSNSTGGALTLSASGRNDQFGRNPGRGGVFMYHGPSVATTEYAELLSAWIPAVGNATYETSALVNPHRCKASLFVQFYNASKTFIGGTGGVSYDSGAGDAGLGAPATGFAGMRLLWGTFAVPSDCAFVRVLIRKFGTNGANAGGSYLFANRTMLCFARPGISLSTATPWIEAGIDQVHGGSLSTGTVDSAQIAAEAATTTARSDGGDPGDMPANPTTYGPINSIGYTASVDCQVTISATVRWYVRDTRVGTPTTGVQHGEYRFCTRVAPTADGIYGNDGVAAGYCSLGVPNEGEFERTTTFQRTFAMTTGEYRAVYLGGAGGSTQSGNGASGGLVLRPVWSQIRLEVVKR